MNCEKYLELISDYLDTNAMDIELKEHLESCSACREELETMQAMVSELNELPAIDLPNGFHERAMSRVREDVEAQKVLKRPAQVRRAVDYKKYTSVAAVVVVCFVLFGSVLSFANNAVTNREASGTAWGRQDAPVAPAPAAPMAASVAAPAPMAEAVDIAPSDQRVAPT